MLKTVLIVEKRSNDFICYLKGNKGYWDCGKTREEAVGKWLITHGSLLSVAIEEYFSQ